MLKADHDHFRPRVNEFKKQTKWNTIIKKTTMSKPQMPTSLCVVKCRQWIRLSIGTDSGLQCETEEEVQGGHRGCFRAAGVGLWLLSGSYMMLMLRFSSHWALLLLILGLGLRRLMLGVGTDVRLLVSLGQPCWSKMSAHSWLPARRA